MIAQILIADDDEIIASLLEEFLSGQNHRVIVARDGFQLAQKAAEHRPHMIITDIQMPGAYGSSAYQVLQRDPATRDIPVLFISAHPYERLRNVLPNSNKTRFLQKPIVLAALEKCIQELLPLGGYLP